MAVDMFLDINGVKGESRDKAHSQKIDVLSWSWGMSNSGSAHVGGGAGAGKVDVQDISVTKYVDSASPVLMKACANGSHFDKATLTVRKAGGTSPVEYVTIHMNEVFITAVATGGSGGEDRLTENVLLNFAKVDLYYTPQTEKGAKGTPIGFKWDIATNSAD
jgi:type VI secretion system secreted protein Hcp